MYSSYLTLIVPAAIALAVTYISALFLRSYLFEAGVTSVDHNKRRKPVLASSGGVAVAFGFSVGVLAYIFGASFGMYTPKASLVDLFAVVLSVLLISFVGFIDDINVSKVLVKTTDMMDHRKGLKQWQKPLLTFIGAVPLMAVNAGIHTLNIPFLGVVNFGIFYPLVLLPLAIVFAANAFNLLGGFDGISSGSGLIASLGLLVYSIIFGTYVGAVVSAIVCAAAFAFLLFDRYPATMLSGDSFTYCMGAAMAAAMIIGSMEAFGIVVFMPWIIEFLLHLRRRFKVKDLGNLRSDGTFEPPYGKKIYSWTHLIMNLRRCKEWEVSLYMWTIELGFVLLAFALKALGLL